MKPGTGNREPGTRPVLLSMLLCLTPCAVLAQTYELAVELGIGSGIRASTEEGYGPTDRQPVFATLHVGYQWEGDTSPEIGFGVSVPVENRAGLLLVPRVRLNRCLAQGWWIFGGLGAAADVLPEARFGGEIELGARYDLLPVLAVYLAATGDVFVAGPGVGRQGIDLALSFILGLRTRF